MARGTDVTEGVHQDLVFLFGCLPRPHLPPPLSFLSFEISGSIRHGTDRRLRTIRLTNQLENVPVLHLGRSLRRIAHGIADGLVGQVHLRSGNFFGLGDARQMEGNPNRVRQRREVQLRSERTAGRLLRLRATLRSGSVQGYISEEFTTGLKGYVY